MEGLGKAVKKLRSKTAGGKVDIESLGERTEVLQ